MPLDEAVNAPHGVFVVQVHGAQCCTVFCFYLQQSLAVTCCTITCNGVLYPSVKKLDGRRILVVVKVVPGAVKIRWVLTARGVVYFASCEGRTLGEQSSRANQDTCQGHYAAR